MIQKKGKENRDFDLLEKMLIVGLMYDRNSKEKGYQVIVMDEAEG